MPFKKVLAGASLLLLAFVAMPAAYAANDGDIAPPSASPNQTSPPQTSPSPTAKPHRVMDPAKRAALKAKRQARREARRQARQQQIQGAAPN
jgi:hypothetical protein